MFSNEHEINGLGEEGMRVVYTSKQETVTFDKQDRSIHGELTSSLTN